MIRSSLVLFAMLAAFSSAAVAASFQFKEAKVEITSPDGWKSAQEGEEVTFTAPDDSVSVVFLLLPAGSEGKAAEYIDKELDKAIGKITWGAEPQKETINEMAFEIWEGKAKDGAVSVDAAYVDTPADRTLATFWFATPEAEKKHEEALISIVKGIKPLK